MALLSNTVDEFFLAERLTYNQEQVAQLTLELQARVNANTKTDAILKASNNLILRKNSLEKRKKLFTKMLLSTQQLDRKLNAERVQLNQQLDTLKKKYNVGLLDFSPYENNDVNAKNIEVDKNTALIKSNETEIEHIKSWLTNLEDTVEENNTAIAGETSVLEDAANYVKDKVNTLSSFTSNFDVSKIWNSLEAKIDNYLDLMIIWIIKTIFLPLLFLYAWLKIFKMIKL